MKKCSSCLVEKELSEFYNNKVNVDGICGRCKICVKKSVS